MNDASFDWDPWEDEQGNTQHVLRHGVLPEEVEEAVLDPRRLGEPAYNVDEERRWALL